MLLCRSTKSRARLESNYPRQIMDVSFKARCAYNSNGGATVSPKPVPINCIILCLPLLFISGHIGEKKKNKRSSPHIAKEKRALKAQEVCLSKMEYLLTCSVGVGSEQTLATGSTSGWNSWSFWNEKKGGVGGGSHADASVKSNVTFPARKALQMHAYGLYFKNKNI